jgi:hypothetical protein
MAEKGQKRGHRVDNSMCSIDGCDWEIFNHRHRIDPEEGYGRDNVVVFCPNHHAELEAIYMNPETRFSLTELGHEVVVFLRQQ